MEERKSRNLPKPHSLWRLGCSGRRANSCCSHSPLSILHSRLQRGFTLLEVLVVVVITAVLVAALTLSVGASGERQLANATERFQALFGHACNQAELSGREIGASISAGGYVFMRLDGDRWSALPASGELRPRQWPINTRLELSRAGIAMTLATAPQAAPQLVCFSSGEATPFVLVVRLGEVPVRYRITGADDGTLKADRIEAAR